MGLADAPLITSQAEGVIFTIEASATRLNLLKTALQRLQAAHAPVVGAVLTKFTDRGASYGYGYGYGYGSDQGEAA